MYSLVKGFCQFSKNCSLGRLRYIHNWIWQKNFVLTIFKIPLSLVPILSNPALPIKHDNGQIVYSCLGDDCSWC